MKVVLASNNQGKIHELQHYLQAFNVDVVSQQALSVPDVEETGLTFVENAILKARHAAKLTDLPAIADDSGLEVFALGGKPGIFSARYAGTHGIAKDNIAKVLKELANVPDEKRQARFYCVLVMLLSAEDPTPLICTGSWDGIILKTPQGEKGFGYDPIFYVPSEQCSAAELSTDQKNKLSHRGKALQQLVAELPLKLSSMASSYKIR